MTRRRRRFERYEDHVRYVQCVDCPKQWRYGCPECADDFADYHRDAFPGHHVLVNGRGGNDTWEQAVPSQISNLFGRY